MKNKICTGQPVRKNSRHIIEIKSVTEKGFGVGEIGGFTVFTEGALTGDVIDILLVKVKKNYGYGKITQIITPSPFRIKSPCPVSGRCGGCQWQHCEYTAQLAFKKEIVINALERIGGVKNPPVFDVTGMENPERYRNKAVFPVVPAVPDKKVGNSDYFIIGMYAPRSHRIIEVEDCLIQNEAHIKILAAVKGYMRAHKIPAYDETTHTGIMRHIVVRTSLATGEVMVVLVIKESGLPAIAKLTAGLAALGVTTVLVNRNNSRGNTIFGEDFQIISGAGFISEKIGGIFYRLSAPSFFQVNPVQAQVLYETAITQAGLDGTQTVIDAHAGAGGVALFAARHAHAVLGVDIAETTVKDAKKNAGLNGIKNVEFICGAAEEIIPAVMGAALQGVQKFARPDVIFLDPPRKGCDPALLKALIAAKTPKIVYISCDPATLARDVKTLTTGGYTLTEAHPVDMFPYTGKVECVSVLQRIDT